MLAGCAVFLVLAFCLCSGHAQLVHIRTEKTSGSSNREHHLSEKGGLIYRSRALGALLLAFHGSAAARQVHRRAPKAAARSPNARYYAAPVGSALDKDDQKQPLGTAPSDSLLDGENNKRLPRWILKFVNMFAFVRSLCARVAHILRAFAQRVAAAISGSKRNPGAESAGSTMPLWSIVGDALIVRSAQSLQSDAAPEWLMRGAVVQEAEISGQRLHYKLVSGMGPREGWISTKLKERSLAERLPLTGYPAPGDRVRIWSTRKHRWFTDGIVKEAIVQDTRVHGQMLCNGSILVGYDHHADQKWISPSEQPQILRRMPLPSTLDLKVGDAVLVWSMSARRWFDDGLVRMVAEKDIQLQSCQIERGSAYVVYGMGGGVKWISPSEIPELLRRLPRQFNLPQETARVVASEDFKPPDNIEVPLLELQNGEELTLFAWYGEMFRFCYGRNSSGIEGWFPAGSVRPLSEEIEIHPSVESILEDVKSSETEEDALETAVESEAGAVGPADASEDNTAEEDRQAEDGERAAEAEDAQGAAALTAAKAAVMQEMMAARSRSQIQAADGVKESSATEQAGLEPKLARRLAAQQQKVSTGKSAVGVVGSLAELKPAKLEPALEALLKRQLRKCEETPDSRTDGRITLNKVATPQKKKETSEGIAILDSGLAARLARQRAKCEDINGLADEAEASPELDVKKEDINGRVVESVQEQLEQTS
mmetsp:Transcript_6889/g.12544  ORF Transcript_6889/g.12544 Transcript_6889/m.12544 type:complete len:711 (-) Transcript_6889:140-2272(-)